MKSKTIATTPDEDLDVMELPEGWSCVTIGNICQVQGGFAFKSKEYQNEGIPLIRISNLIDDEVKLEIKNPFILPFLAEKYPSFLLKKNDYLIALSGATTGKVAINNLNQLAFLNQRVGRFCLKSDSRIDNKFFWYVIKNISRRVLSEAYGGAQPNISPKDIERIKFPLPPLAEQQRIVARIEALLAHVNPACDRLIRVPLIMKKFRQAVLAVACSGRLTEGWREENPDIENVSTFIEKLKEEKVLQDEKRMKYLSDSDFSICSELPSTWGWVKLGEIAIAVDVDHKMPKAIANGIPLISPKDFVNPDKINLKDTKKISQDDYNRMCRKITPENGDILLSRYGTIGKVRKAPANEKFQISYSLCLIRPFLDLKSNDYLYWILQSLPVYHQVLANDKSSSIPDLGIKDINNFSIPLPPVVEQHEIVRRVNALFERADAIEREVTAATMRTEALIQAVLGKASRGELITNDSKAN